jgi:hypothetical protein
VVQGIYLKPLEWDGKNSVATFVAQGFGGSVFDSNGAGLSCFFFHASAAAGWAYAARCKSDDNVLLKHRVVELVGSGTWLDGMQAARTSLACMADSASGVDAVDAEDVRRSCLSPDGMRCVSEAGAAVLAVGLGVAVSVLIVNRNVGGGCECPEQLRVYHPDGVMKRYRMLLDSCMNLLLDSGSGHWMASEYPVGLEMAVVRQAAEDELGLGSSSFAVLPPMFW